MDRVRLGGRKLHNLSNGAGPGLFQGRHATNHGIAAAEVTLHYELEGIMENSTIAVEPDRYTSLTDLPAQPKFKVLRTRQSAGGRYILLGGGSADELGIRDFALESVEKFGVLCHLLA